VTIRWDKFAQESSTRQISGPNANRLVRVAQHIVEKHAPGEGHTTETTDFINLGDDNACVIDTENDAPQFVYMYDLHGTPAVLLSRNIDVIDGMLTAMLAEAGQLDYWKAATTEQAPGANMSNNTRSILGSAQNRAAHLDDGPTHNALALIEDLADNGGINITPSTDNQIYSVAREYLDRQVSDETRKQAVIDTLTGPFTSQNEYNAADFRVFASSIANLVKSNDIKCTPTGANSVMSAVAAISEWAQARHAPKSIEPPF
jgi:hypothetical protein